MKKQIKALIIGSGSVGNHLAYGCRTKDWGVVVFDRDDVALDRMRTEIFPSRYGCWDQEIELVNEFPDTGSGQFEVVFIGTPPDSHIALSSGVLEYLEPDVLVIEKPLAVPSMDGVDEFLHRCEGV